MNTARSEAGGDARPIDSTLSGERVVGVLARGAIACIRVYQLTLGQFVGGRCRFHPTCSTYAAEAFASHGAARGMWLTIKRLARCHPLGGHGVDPVPPSQAARSHRGVDELPAER